MNFTPFPELTTSRLTIRKLRIDDHKEVLFLRSDEAVNKFIKRAAPKNLDDAEDFINKVSAGAEDGNIVYWAITMKDSPVMIGSICLWQFSKDEKEGEVGYDLNPAFHKQGIMSEALRCVLDFGFNNLKLDRIEAFTHRLNKGSVQLLLKNGFTELEGRADESNLDNAIFSVASGC